MIKNRAYVASYQIRVGSEKSRATREELQKVCDEWGDLNAVQIGGEFETFEEACKYASDCADSDGNVSVQRLFHGGYVECGNIYYAESVELDEDGEEISYIEGEFYY